MLSALRERQLAKRHALLTARREPPSSRDV
jgi:hypothetical protein